MDVSVRTQKKTSISRKNDKVVIKEVETTTTTRKGMPPEVRVVERVREYDIHDIPEELKQQLGSLALQDDDTDKKVRKFSSQGWIQAPAQKDSDAFQKRVSTLPPPTQIKEDDLEKLNEDCVKCHNMYRSKHGVPPLVYSKQLADYAQNWAEDLAMHQRFEHRKDDSIGENLYMYYSSDPLALATASDACDNWYSEIKNFKFGKEPKNLSAGHFSQMIWKDTKKVGMGRARGPTGKQIIVADYDPPGNYVGSFAKNVPQPLS